MKKVCFITTKPGALRVFVLDAAKTLHERDGIDITLICDINTAFKDSLPEYITYLPVSMKRGISLSGFFVTMQLYKIFKTNAFDLVQYSTPNASLYACVAAKLAKVPVRLYCQWGIYYVGLSGFPRWFFKRVEKSVCRLSTKVRAVSKKNLEFAVQEGLFKREKGYVLGMGGTIGVNLAQYSVENKEAYRQNICRQKGIGTEEFVFGFVGRFTRDKGVNELLSAIKNMATSEPIRLLCIGSNEVADGVDMSLFSWAKESERVIFMGYIENAELKNYYAAMDCYVLPSYREGFGMTLQEAAAMGCAIVTTDIPGASEVMEEGISCLLAKARDASSLEEKMRMIYSDRDLCRRLGTNARIRVEKYFNRDDMVERQRQDYINMLK